jgi:hypothetical protein
VLLITDSCGRFAVFRVQNASWEYSSHSANPMPDGAPFSITKCADELGGGPYIEKSCPRVDETDELRGTREY